MSKPKPPKFAFSVSIETEHETGDVVSVYFRIRNGTIHETREFADGAAFADYDKRGWLQGIELLAPCSVSIVDRLAKDEPLDVRRHLKRFLRKSGPQELIAA